jgi:hypothetical protein
VEPAVCGLTFELTPTAEAGGVSPVTDDATNGGRRAYDACRSGSGAERGVRPHVCSWLAVSEAKPLMAVGCELRSRYDREPRSAWQDGLWNTVLGRVEVAV